MFEIPIKEKFIFFTYDSYVCLICSSIAAIPNRDHVFHISFPLNWKQSDIVNHFRKFGSVFIRWINQTSAYVALNNRENSSILLDSVAKVKGVRVITFEQHSKETNQTDGVRIFVCEVK